MSNIPLSLRYFSTSNIWTNFQILSTTLWKWGNNCWWRWCLV